MIILRGKEFAPKDFNKAVNWWKSIASDEDADYDDIVEIDGSEIEPMVTWGINPGQAAGISENFPEINELPGDERETAKEAYEHTSYEPGTPVKGTEINVAFVGSCTNSRISDLREAAKMLVVKKYAKNIKDICSSWLSASKSSSRTGRS